MKENNINEINEMIMCNDNKYSNNNNNINIINV